MLVLFLNAFLETDPFSGDVIPVFSLDAFVTLFTTEVYRTIALRTVGMALLVTVTCAVIGFPVAYYVARIASPRTRRLLIVAVAMPLWASYLVKIYTWRTMLGGNGFVDWLLAPIGLESPGLNSLVSAWIVFTYLWLPYMVVPIVAGLGSDPALAPRSVVRPGRQVRADLPPGRRSRSSSRPLRPARSSPSR